MKKIFILSTVIVLSCACSSGDGYVIKGRSGLMDGKAVLSYRGSDDAVVKDTVLMEKGRFVFTGKVEDVFRGTVTLLPEGSDALDFALFVENSKMNVSVNPESFVDYGAYGEKFIKAVSVTGSSNNAFWYGVNSQKEIVSGDSRYAEIAAALEELENTGYADMALYKSREKDFREKYADDIPAYSAAVDSVLREYALANPDVECAAYLFKMNAENLPLKEFEAGFNSFSEKVRTSHLAEPFRNEIASRHATEPGQVAPDFTLGTPDGREVTLSSLFGQYLLIDFWASWCGPCRAGVPGLKELYAKYHDKGFEIIGIADDSNPESWKKALAEDKSPWIHVLDEFPDKNKPARVSSLYGVHYIPSYFLLDREGCFIGKFDHDGLEAKLHELLDK